MKVGGKQVLFSGLLVDKGGAKFYIDRPYKVDFWNGNFTMIGASGAKVSFDVNGTKLSTAAIKKLAISCSCCAPDSNVPTVGTPFAVSIAVPEMLSGEMVELNVNVAGLDLSLVYGINIAHTYGEGISIAHNLNGSVLEVTLENQSGITQASRSITAKMVTI